MESKSDIEARSQRRSNRRTKGVLPMRFSEFVVDNRLEPDLNVPSTSIVETRGKKGNMSSSETGLAGNPMVDNTKGKTKSDIHDSIKASAKTQGSVSSKRSDISKLNLELMMIQKQKQLDEEEAVEKLEMIQKQKQYEEEKIQEKLRAIERRRKNLKKEIDLQKMLIEKDESHGRSQRDDLKSLYSSSSCFNKWVNDAKKCVVSEANSNYSCAYNVNKGSDVSALNGHLNQPSTRLEDMTKQCFENSAAMNKFLFRQKIRDLSHFSGELTDWPIFISEFKRSTEVYELTDEDNILRLDRALKGKARDTVKALLISPMNVGKIIKMLEMNFGRSEWIVLSLMDKAKKMSPIKEEKLETYITFSNTITNMVASMKNVGCGVYLFNPELLNNLIEKLPPIQKYDWAKYKHALEADKKQISLDDFSNWFEEEVNLMASIHNPCIFKSSRRETVMVTKKHAVRDRKEEPRTCLFCKSGNHGILECGDFCERSVAERRAAVLNLKVCFICLTPGHMANRCYHQKMRCGQNGCKGRHNKLLHIDRNVINNEEPRVHTDVCANVSAKDRTVLLRVAPVKLRGPFEEITVFALFDEGSTCSMIEQDLADELKLPGITSPFCYQWTNGITHHEDDSRMTTVEVAAVNIPSIFYNLKKIRTVENLSLPVQQIDVEEVFKKFPYLNRDVLESIQYTKPQLLIGQDNCGLIIPRHIIQPRVNAPIMSKSKLGWTIHGLVDFTESNETVHVSLCCRNVQDEELHTIVKDSFRLESFGVKLHDNLIKSVEDKMAVALMENSIRKVGNQYEICHLWKKENYTLPDSRPTAMKRLFCMERKMDKDKFFAEKYCEKIEDYVKKGYASRLNDVDIIDTPKTWYLPHFAVWNINKPGRIRLVFDAAAKSHGYSLNDFLLQGPDYVPSLISILWRFRQGKVAINGDIKEMFHQVKIKQDDRCAQRFLWRGTDRSRKPDVYQMNVMIFGAISSPSIAQFIKNRNAENFEPQYPGILKLMKKQHYVDDYLDSCDSEEEAIERVRSVIHVHQQGGFEMTKWISNSEKVILSVPENLRSSIQDKLKIDSQQIERVLGLRWYPRDDTFIFTLNLKNLSTRMFDDLKIPTKREVLRTVMSIFDPLGFLAPLMIKARLLMQEIWKMNIDWDMEIVHFLEALVE